MQGLGFVVIGMVREKKMTDMMSHVLIMRLRRIFVNPSTSLGTNRDRRFGGQKQSLKD